MSEPVVIFWSWQSDSDSQTNRNFIEDCIDRANRVLKREDSIIVSVDRDTKGVGGAPPIVDTILTKIRSADLFIWDATLVTKHPRPAPNPNVLIEHGYALAVLGEGRMIGVMNSLTEVAETDIPFDMRHKRWPIRYALAPRGYFDPLKYRLLGRRFETFEDRRKRVREKLVKVLADAIRDALAEPKRGAMLSDIDLHAAKLLWKIVDSKWVRNWHEVRTTYCNEEEDTYIDVFNDYIREAQKPECQFDVDDLRETHGRFVAAIRSYLSETASEMIPSGGRRGHYQISTKVNGKKRFLENYDREYERQISIVEAGADRVWECWNAYVRELRKRYPEVMS